MWRGPSERTAGPRNRGFTLLETLVSAALFSLVITGIYLLYTTMQNTMSRGELKSDLQQNARVGMDQMTRELRMAGYDPISVTYPYGIIPLVILPPKTAIRAATPTCVSFVADVSGSGTASQITYDLSETSLRRRVDTWSGSPGYQFSGGSAQPLAESVNSLIFTYYDTSNNVLAPGIVTYGCPPGGAIPATALTFGQLLQVRRVAITLATRDSRPGVLSEFYTLTSDVRLRNK